MPARGPGFIWRPWSGISRHAEAPWDQSDWVQGHESHINTPLKRHNCHFYDISSNFEWQMHSFQPGDSKFTGWDNKFQNIQEFLGVSDILGKQFLEKNWIPTQESCWLTEGQCKDFFARYKVLEQIGDLFWLCMDFFAILAKLYKTWFDATSCDRPLLLRLWCSREPLPQHSPHLTPIQWCRRRTR